MTDLSVCPDRIKLLTVICCDSHNMRLWTVAPCRVPTTVPMLRGIQGRQ